MKNIIRFETTHHKEIDEKFHQLNIGNIGNVIYWWKFFESIAGISGDIVECGVGRSRSLLVISAINQFLDQEEGGKRNIYAYDSFEGFPEPSVEDHSSRSPKRGEWAESPSKKYQYSISFTEMVLREAGVNLTESHVIIKKGFFGKTLPHHPDRPIALLHVDGDLYQSYMDVLSNLYDKVVKGGIVVFDDFLHEWDGEERWPGARKATQEFLGDKFNDLKISFRGNYYYVKN